MNEEMQKLYAEEGINPMSGCLWTMIPFPILIALYSIIRQPITHFMMLPASAVETLIQTATKAGVNMANIVQFDKAGEAIVKNGFTQLASYGQINLVKAVQEMGLATPDGWFNVNYNFLGLDLTATPWEFIKNFTFTWAVIGVILIPILSGLSQFILSKITMSAQPQQADASAASMKSMMYMMPLMSVYIAFIMPAALGVYWIAQSVFSLIQELVLNKTLNAKMEAEEEARFQGAAGGTPEAHGGRPPSAGAAKAGRAEEKDPAGKAAGCTGCQSRQGRQGCHQHHRGRTGGRPSLCPRPVLQGGAL